MRFLPRALTIPSAGLVALAAGTVVAAAPATAHDHGQTVYLAANSGAAASRYADGRHPQSSSTQGAGRGVRLRGTVVVCRGTYAGSVTVDRQVRLLGYGAT